MAGKEKIRVSYCKTCLHVVGVLFLSIVMQSKANTQERLRLVHADSLVTRTVSDKVIRELWG